MTELLLVRHALPQSGTVNPGLSEQGREQARRLGDWLKGADVDALVCSPMPRALETAEIAAAQMGRTVDAVVDDLREWDTDLPPRAYEALEVMDPLDERARAIAEGRFDDFVPDLDRDAFRARAASVLADVLDRWPVPRVVAVCHGGLLNTIIGGVLGIEPLFWHNPGYTSISRLQRVPAGRVVVAAVNETAHLYATRD